MNRVPTTATYRLYMSRMSNQKENINRVSYQSVTGNKEATYDGYGLTSYRIVNLQNERNIVEKYAENNAVTKIMFDSQQTALDGMRSAVVTFRNSLREFYGNDLTSMAKDPSDEDLIALKNVQENAFEALSLVACYLNTQVDGNYIFGGGENKVKPVDFPYVNLADFQEAFNGKSRTYPSTYSASLSQMQSTAIQTGGITIEQEYQTLVSVTEDIVLTAPVYDQTTRTLTGGNFSNLVAGDKVIIDGGPNAGTILTVESVATNWTSVTFAEDVDPSAATQLRAGWHFQSVTDPSTGEETNTLTGKVGEFSSLKVGQEIKIDNTTSNDGVWKIASISSDGRTITFDNTVTNEFTTAADAAQIEQSLDTGVITATNVGGFITDSMTCSPMQTGEVSFNARMNTMNATGKGAFSAYKVGDTLLLDGTGSPNDRMYKVAAVSEDGRTITFDDDTPVAQTQSAAALTGLTVVINKTYPIGAIIEMSGTSNLYNGKYTVADIDSTGTFMTVKSEEFPPYGATASFANAAVETDSYYNGGHISTTYRLNENNAVSNDVNAASVAFEKALRAMGEIAQGNLLDADNPEETTARVEEALTLLEEALNANSAQRNYSMTGIQYSIISKLDLISTTIDAQTETQASLESYLNDLTQVDKTEAVTYLLQAKTDLETSYSVLAQINKMSLLNYI